MLSLRIPDRNVYDGSPLNWGILDPHKQHADLHQWAMQRGEIRDHQDDIGWDKNDHGLEHPAWHDTMCNIITETSVHSSGFVSEKTTKPLAAGQLWCMVSGSDTVNQLRRLGFDTMDDVWQSHVYLSMPEWTQRIEIMLQHMDQLIPHLQDIWHRTLGQRQHNREWLFGDELSRRVLAPLHDRELLTKS
jgi:hypothetical protein